MPAGTVILTIDDPATSMVPDYTAQTSSQPGAEPGPDFTFLLGGAFDIQPGHQVTVSDGTTTKTHTITELVVTAVHAATDTVSGTAAPGSEVWVPTDPGVARTVQADATTGEWTADFSVPGAIPEEHDLYDIQAGSHGRAQQVDDDGDFTAVDWELAPPPTFAEGLVAGTVRLAGVPVAAGVGACPVGEQGPMCPSVRFTNTDPDGTYSLALPAGDWSVGAFAVDENGAPLQPLLLGPTQIVTIVADQTSPADLTLPPYGFASGTVTHDGTPVSAGVLIGACPTGETGPLCPSLRTVNTDADGHYRVALPVGEWGLAALLDLDHIGPSETVSITNATTTAQDLVYDLDYSAVAGAVTDTNGAVLLDGITGASLCPGTGGPFDETCPGLKFALHDPNDGSYALAALPGTYTLWGFHYPNGFPGPVQTSTPTTVELTADQTLTCTLTIGGTTDCAVPADGDDDGVPGVVEDGAPNGGDGNNDGIPDSEQAHVTSLLNAVDGQYVTLVAPAGVTLVNVTTSDVPASAPSIEAAFPIGLVGFEVHGIAEGAEVDVELLSRPGRHRTPTTSCTTVTGSISLPTRRSPVTRSRCISPTVGTATTTATTTV